MKNSGPPKPYEEVQNHIFKTAENVHLLEIFYHHHVVLIAIYLNEPYWFILNLIYFFKDVTFTTSRKYHTMYYHVSGIGEISTSRSLFIEDGNAKIHALTDIPLTFKLISFKVLDQLQNKTNVIIFN